MRTKTTTSITEVKREIRLCEWEEQIMTCLNLQKQETKSR